MGLPSPSRIRPWTKRGSTISLAGAMPPPMRAWPSGGVTSAVKEATCQAGGAAKASPARAAASPAAIVPSAWRRDSRSSTGGSEPFMATPGLPPSLEPRLEQHVDHLQDDVGAEVGGHGRQQPVPPVEQAEHHAAQAVAQKGERHQAGRQAAEKR